MDREKLKSATSGRAPGKRGGKAGQATEPADALGGLATLTLQGKPYTAGALTFNGLRRAQARFGSVGVFAQGLAAMDLDAILFLIHECLLPAHPDLDEEELGELLPIQDAELLPMLEQVLAVSGLTPKKGAQETAAATD